MKISLFQGILFAVFIVAALIGLFVFATHKSTSGSDAIGTVVIWGTLPQDDMDNALTLATQNNPSLKSVSYVEQDPASLPQNLASAIATGNAPDLLLVSQEELLSLTQYISAIPSATLPANTFENTFAEAGNVYAENDGSGYYGMPFLIDPLVLFSNRTILSSDGIAEPPSTWEALTGLVPNVAILTPSRGVTRGLIALGTYDNVHDARGILSALFLQTDVPISSYADTGLLSADLGESNSNDSTSPGDAVVTFYTQFADPSKISYTWNESLPDSQQVFLSGDLALYLGYASEAQYFTAANPNLDFQVSAFPEPATATSKTTYGLVYAFLMPNGASNPTGAYQVALLLTSPAVQAQAASATGLAPATLTTLSDVPSDPTSAITYAEALYAKGWLSPAPADTDSIFSSMINSVISGASDTDTALTTAQTSLDSLLQ